MNILGFLLPWWAKPLAIALVFAALISAFFYAKNKYDASVRAPVFKELRLVKDMLDACHKNGESLKNSIEIQNKAIDGIKAAADKRAADSAKAVAEAKKLTTKSNERVNAIIASAPLHWDICESARLRMIPQ